MVDFRNILERGKSNYTVVFNRLSPKNKGIFEAAYNYINDAFPILENEGIPADDVDTILSITIGGMLFGVNETYKQFDFKEKPDDEEEEFDLDRSTPPFDPPPMIIEKIKKKTEEAVEEETTKLIEELTEKTGLSSDKLKETINEVLSLPSSTNLMSYLLFLTAAYFYNKASEMEEADERKEPLPRVKFDESGFSSSFQDEFKMEKWFDNLRK